MAETEPGKQDRPQGGSGTDCPEPAEPPWWDRHHLPVLFAIVFVLFLAGLPEVFLDWSAGAAGFRHGLLSLLSLLAILGVVFLFIYAFTNPLDGLAGSAPEGEGGGDRASDCTKVQHQNFKKLLLPLRLSYLFMILSIGGSILPFAYLDRQHIENSTMDQFESPLQVLIGCVEGKPSEADISCANPDTRRQWLVSLGGGVSNKVQFNTTAATAALVADLEALRVTVRSMTQLSYDPGRVSDLLGDAGPQVDAVNKALEDWQVQVARNGVLAAQRDAIRTLGERFGQVAGQELEDIAQALDAARNAACASIRRGSGRWRGAAPHEPPSASPARPRGRADLLLRDAALHQRAGDEPAHAGQRRQTL
nr:hypothetical protein [Mangrovicoccus ximenensis]